MTDKELRKMTPQLMRRLKRRVKMIDAKYDTPRSNAALRRYEKADAV